MKKIFLNMDAELRQFKDTLSSMVCKLLLITGEKGTGKSTLLKHFRALSDQEGVPSAFINFAGTSYNPIDILSSMGEIIGLERCVNLNRTLDDFLKGSDIVIQDNRLAFGAKITVQVSAELNQRDRNDRRLWYRHLTSALLEDLRRADIERAILYMDTYEEAPDEITEWVSTHLLPLLSSQQKLTVVISCEKAFDLDVEWEDLYIRLSLSGLALQYWFKYLEEQKITTINPEWVIASFKLYDGKPAAMTTALEKFMKQSISAKEEEEEKYWDLLDIYLERLADAEQEYIKALSVFHWFDESIGERVWADLGLAGSAMTAWSAIVNLPFVSATPQGFTYHELYRNALLGHLWRDRRDLFMSMASLASQIFIQEDLAEKVERAYHLILAEPQNGRDLLRQLVVDFQDQGLYSLWHTLTQYSLEHTQAGRLDAASAALVWESAGQYASIFGKNKDAIERLNNAKSLYAQVNDSEGQIRVLFSIAIYQSLIGQMQESEANLQSAYRLAERNQHSLYAAHIMYRIAELENYGGNPKSSYDKYEKSFQLFELVGDFAMQARNLMFMAETLQTEDKQEKIALYQRALPLYEQGWERYQQMSEEDPGFSAATFIGGFASRSKVKRLSLFNVAIDQGDCLQTLGEYSDTEQREVLYREALASYTRALPLTQQMKDLRWSARAILRVADMQVRLGDLAVAEPLYQDALNQSQRVAHKLYEGWSHVGIGNIARLRGDKENARNHYLQAQALYQEIGAHSNISWQIKPNLALLDEQISSAGN